MTELSQEILAHWQVRNKKRQKEDFIAFLREKLPGLTVEEGGLPNSKNLVLGDVDSARVVFSAHYDTCTALPFPNFLTPKNIPLYILYNLLIGVAVFVLAFSAAFFARTLTQNLLITKLASLGVCFLCLFLMLGGKPNPHTANDNTSGVISLCEIYAALSEEQRGKAAFVFFDNEELGLFGSRRFLKLHKKAMKGKLLLNLDCVSDGDHLMLIQNKAAREAWGPALEKAFGGEAVPAGKELLMESSSSTLYPSDQLGFPCYAAAAAFQKGRVGFYMTRIHTKKDTVLQEENISWIRDSGRRLMESLPDRMDP